MLAVDGCGQTRAPHARTDFAAERERMVSEQIVRRGIHDPRVLAAMRKVPREEFIPAELRDEAYADGPLPLGEEETISQPYIVGLMTELLRPQPSDRVLKSAPVRVIRPRFWRNLLPKFTQIEIDQRLARQAEATLQRHHCSNVHVKAGDGYKGWPEHAPFDCIIVTCALDHVPRPLIEQLKERGRMVIPVGERSAQELYLLEKRNGELNATIGSAGYFRADEARGGSALIYLSFRAEHSEVEKSFTFFSSNAKC